MQLVHYSYAELGQLQPAIDDGFLDSQHIAKTRGSNKVIISGVELSDNLLQELKLLGYPLLSYNRGELEDAVIACSYDRKLVDDENGHGFRDKLTLTAQEKLSKSRKKKTAATHFDDDDCDIVYC